MKNERPLRAFGWMTLSGLAFSIMGAEVKYLTPEIPFYTIVFFRSAISALLLFPLVYFSQSAFFPTGKRILVIRGVFGFCGLCCFFYAISGLSLSLAAMLVRLSPIFAILFSRIFLGERVSREALFWSLITFVGLGFLIEVNHWFYSERSYSLALLPIGVGICGSVFAGAAYTAVRAATQKFSILLIVFYFNAVAAIASFPFLFLGEAGWGILLLQKPYSHSIEHLALVGTLGVFAQLGMTIGYYWVRAGIASVLTLMASVFSVLWGVILFDEVLHPQQILGMAILLGGIVMLTLRGTRSTE